MNYYIASAKLAERLGVRLLRFGNNKDGYLINQSDIAVVGMEEALKDGLKAITDKEAEQFKKNL